MAHVEDRWFREVRDPATGKVRRVKTDRYGKGSRYRVRYVDVEGRERSESFPDRQKKAAEDFMHRVQNELRQGTYLDPDAGKITFEEYAEQWLAGQVFKATTRTNIPSRLKNQAYPFLGRHPLAAITPTVIRGWVRWMQSNKVAPNYRRVCFVHVSAILTAAVDDKRIPENPCNARRVTKPQAERKKVVPWTDARLKSVWLALPARSKIIVSLGAGCGLRQGEMFGLSPADLDRQANVLRVVRQVQQVDNRLVFCLPKGDKEREVPLPAGVLRDLDAYAEAFPPVAVTLPWEEADGKPITVRLCFTDDDARPWWRQVFNREVWRPALERAGVVESAREDGTHALRHFYASALLDGGESIKAVSEYLGHADAGFTLRTYTHLMPSSHERTRRVIDKRLARSHMATAPDGPETAQTPENAENRRSDGVLLRTGSRGTG
jgi:integrase